MVHADAGGISFGQEVTGEEYSNPSMHFYICNGNGSDDASIGDAENGKNYNFYLPEYVPEPSPLSIIQACLNDHY